MADRNQPNRGRGKQGKKHRYQAMLAFAHPSKIVDQDDSNNEGSDIQDHKDNNMTEKAKFSLPSAGGWTAIFTAVLTIFSIFEWRVSKTATDIQRGYDRAYLGFTGPILGPLLSSDPTRPENGWLAQEIELNWSNTGETPARDAVIAIGANAFYPDIPANFDFPFIQDRYHVVIGSKSTYWTAIQVPRDTIVDGLHAKKRIFIWGDVVYKDMFDDSPDRLTEFCVELTHLTVGVNQGDNKITPIPPSTQKSGPSENAPPLFNTDDPRTILVAFQWQQCREHNCYDKDCHDYKDRIIDLRK